MDKLCKSLLIKFHFKVFERRDFKTHKSAYLIVLADIILAVFSFVTVANATDLVFVINAIIFLKNIFICKRESKILEDDYYLNNGIKVTRGQQSPYDALQKVSVVLIVLFAGIFILLSYLNANNLGTIIIQIMIILVAICTTLFTLITNIILDLSKIYITEATFSSENITERI